MCTLLVTANACALHRLKDGSSFLTRILLILDEDTRHFPFIATTHTHLDVHAWHRELGRLDFDSLAKMARQGFLAPGGPVLLF